MLSVYNSLLAPTKFVPLSDHIDRTEPLLAKNLHNAIMNESASIVLVISIWTARLKKHVKRAACLRSDHLSLIKIGPNISTPE